MTVEARLVIAVMGDVASEEVLVGGSAIVVAGGNPLEWRAEEASACEDAG